VGKKWQQGSYDSPIEGSSTFVLETLEDGREDDHVRRLLRKSTFRLERFSRESEMLREQKKDHSDDFDKDTIQDSVYSSL